MLKPEKAGGVPRVFPLARIGLFPNDMGNVACEVGNLVYAAWLDVGDRPFPLVGKTLSLGRAKDNNIVFTSTKVSRRHALVHAQGGAEFSLVDLGSSNGTHLNGRRVVHPIPLQHGDIIQIGEQSLVFRLETSRMPEEEIYLTEAQMTVRDVNELTCWFLLLDIQNFVRLSSELQTDELARMVGAWLAECRRVIEDHGGTLSKFLGDGLLVYWDTRFCDTTNVAAPAQMPVRQHAQRGSPEAGRVGEEHEGDDRRHHEPSHVRGRGDEIVERAADFTLDVGEERLRSAPDERIHARGHRHARRSEDSCDRRRRGDAHPLLDDRRRRAPHERARHEQHRVDEKDGCRPRKRTLTPADVDATPDRVDGWREQVGEEHRQESENAGGPEEPDNPAHANVKTSGAC